MVLDQEVCSNYFLQCDNRFLLKLVLTIYFIIFSNFFFKGYPTQPPLNPVNNHNVPNYNGNNAPNYNNNNNNNNYKPSAPASPSTTQTDAKKPFGWSV